jgi:hypothetical protein
MLFEEFKRDLDQSETEEAVKATYARYLKIKYNTAHGHDLYTPQVFFEFKLDKNFENLKSLATVLAQTLYYVRRLKYVDVTKIIPPFLCLADKNEAIVIETNKWNTYYTSDVYDWERPPSKPDPRLVEHLVKEPELGRLHVFKVTTKLEHNAFKKIIETSLNPQIRMNFGDKKSINEENFEAVFSHWKEIIGKYINNGYKLSSYFLSNLQEGKIIVDQQNGRVSFTFEDNNSKVQKILMKDYQYFWDMYEHIDNYEVLHGINAKLDRLTDDETRRFEGEFYTPLIFAKKAIHYLSETLGKKWYKTGKYRIWDMAAGTGNLEWHLPAEAYKYVYMSTLHAGEVDHNKKVFKDATCFQYDYLNDDVEYLFNNEQLPFEPTWKLPQKLREELRDSSLTWVVFINPPFATAQVGGAKGKNKKGVSKTKVEKHMTSLKIGHAKRELFAQFMFRITNELPQKTYLAMFSKLKYLNAPDSIDFRNNYFNYKFEAGFIFKSTVFWDVKGKYPIGFLIWNLNLKTSNEGSIIPLDISNEEAVTIGIKHLSLIKKESVLNNWFDRPSNTDAFILPPLSNGLTVKSNNLDKRHRARPDFLASICSNGNDFQHAKYVVILSSPNASAGAFTVIESNFEKSLVLHAVKKIPKHTWLNDRNQFLVPHSELDTDFINDCVVWSLFASSNETTALKDVKYNGKNYQIRNNFFPFLLSEISRWEITDPDFKLQISRDDDRFVALWIKKQKLSVEANAVLHKAKEVYKTYFSNLNTLPTLKYKIETWDAGWYQIRKCLSDGSAGLEIINELKNLNNALGLKICPQIEEYGFLDKDEVFEQI